MIRFSFIFIAMLFIASCSGLSDKKTGTEGGPCYPNNTCDDGLVCLSKTCVKLGSDSDMATITDTDIIEAEADTVIIDTIETETDNVAPEADNAVTETDIVVSDEDQTDEIMVEIDNNVAEADIIEVDTDTVDDMDTSDETADTTDTATDDDTQTADNDVTTDGLDADTVIIGTVEVPEFDTPTGIYNTDQTITIITDTAGASIRYTLDGTEPSATAGILYSAPVSISTSKTLKAIAYKTGWANSTIHTAVYTLQPSTPSFTPPAGLYKTNQNVTINTSIADGIIIYTIDGTEPTETNGSTYTAPFPISANTVTETFPVVKAKVYKPGWLDSDTGTVNYHMTGKVVTPEMNPIPGTYSSQQSIVLSTATVGATIRYTTDGNEPTNISTQYTEPLVIPSNQISETLRNFQAKAFLTDWLDSDISTGNYTITGTVTTPEFDTPAGIYNADQKVTITTDTPGASIRYSLNGPDPNDKEGTLYTGPINITANTTLKAIAYKTNWVNSPVQNAIYTMQMAAPTFSVTSGTYTTTQNITLSTVSPHSEIRYTTDKTEPTATSTLYTGAINLPTNQLDETTTTIKAKTFSTVIGWEDSATASSTYRITGTVATPVLSPDGGTYSSSQSVAITCATSGATIRYTTDNSEPSVSNGSDYTKIITILKTTKIRAKAFKSGWIDSAITEATYNINSWEKITSFGDHTCGIKTDGKLYCWGSKESSLYGNETTENKTIPTKINDEAWSDVTTGERHTCAIKAADSKLYCWGYNYYGQLGDGTTENKNTPTKIGDDTWHKISIGKEHTCGISAVSKKLYCWGLNSSGQLGIGTTNNKNTPIKISDATWVDIATGDDHTCAISAINNKLYCWGDNTDGQLGDGTSGYDCPNPFNGEPGNCADKKIPTQIGNEAWSKISARYNRTSGIALTGSKLYFWGANTNTPTKINDDEWFEMAIGNHTCAISLDSKLYCWGNNYYGQLGDGTTDDKSTPVKGSDDGWSAITIGSAHTCGIKISDSRLYCWGSNQKGQIGDGTIAQKAYPTQIGDDEWQNVSGEASHTCGIKTSDGGKLYCWGYNVLAQLGDGTSDNKNTPIKIGDDAWSQITAGYLHTCGISAFDSKLYCWGENSSGELGDGTNESRNIPIKIGDDTWAQITAGGEYTCGISVADSKLYCWGYNGYGQLGDGTNENKNTPTKISDEEWADVTTGEMHTCAIKEDDSKLYCWGYNDYGQLGDGTTVWKNIPTKIGDDAWQNISVGSYHTCGIKSADSKLYCWGRNDYGQLGNGTTANKNSPTKISDEEWADVTTGERHTCAIKEDDSKLYCWGYNDYGQLGDGTTVWKNIPTKIGDEAWLTITAGVSKTCGISATSKKLYCWGRNDYGQLGDGSAWKTEPTLVAGQ